MEYAIGIDLGGTNIKAAAVTPSGEVLGQSSAETRDGEGAAWAACVRGQIGALESRLGGAALCVGIASVGGHLESLQDFDWFDYLGDGGAVALLNDGHAALLAEAWKGAAAGADDA